MIILVFVLVLLVIRLVTLGESFKVQCVNCLVLWVMDSFRISYDTSNNHLHPAPWLYIQRTFNPVPLI